RGVAGNMPLQSVGEIEADRSRNDEHEDTTADAQRHRVTLQRARAPRQRITGESQQQQWYGDADTERNRQNDGAETDPVRGTDDSNRCEYWACTRDEQQPGADPENKSVAALIDRSAGQPDEGELEQLPHGAEDQTKAKD